jgi:hypothetical protein
MNGPREEDRCRILESEQNVMSIQNIDKSCESQVNAQFERSVVPPVWAKKRRILCKMMNRIISVLISANQSIPVLDNSLNIFCAQSSSLEFVANVVRNRL